MGVSSLRSSISISVVFHALFVLACLILASQRPAETMKKLTWIEVQPITLPPTVKKSTDDSVKKQVVQTEDGRKIDKALPDSFLGEKNQVVDRQTVSRNHTTQMGHTAQAKAPKTTQAKKETEEQAQNKLGTLNRLGLPMLPMDRGVGANLPNAPEQPEWANLGKTPEDFVKGLKESDRTALNTKEFIFYGYFQRIRERLDRAWVPILRENLFKFYRSGRQLASDMDHATKVLVVLNRQGEIVKVQLLNESGTKDLDDAAVRAFNKAGPFPNPPHGIMNQVGEIQIPWEFVLKT